MLQPKNLNTTHDPLRRTWVDAGDDPSGQFPLQNLPYGVFRTPSDTTPRLGVAIGNQAFDLCDAAAAGLLPGATAAACRGPDLNGLMALGNSAWSGLRGRLSELLGDDTCPAGERRDAVRKCLWPLRDLELLLPARIGNYTDFYASSFHAANVGSLFRPDSPLLPNYKWVPIGYHGRASSIVVSETPVRRPSGQIKSPDASAPSFGPTRQLDYELELGAFVGVGNALGSPIPIGSAQGHIFGVSLLNDWSARDIQAWEYQPLGPFLAKNFASSVSPWVVTWEALAPFRVPSFSRPAGDPRPLPYLFDREDQATGGLDIVCEVYLSTPRMRDADLAEQRISTGSFASMYWTLAQLIAHHSSNGCNLCPGDLLGSGTISGPEKSSRGCLLELTSRGQNPVELPNGETRAFLEDGDEVILRGYADRPGARRIGLGECRGRILPAHA
jgi:fumarylacetoacetase